MPYWPCYHSADEHGRLPGDHDHRMDSAQFALDGNTHGAELCGIYTKKGAVYDAIGDTVFLITGLGRSPKKYFLSTKSLDQHSSQFIAKALSPAMPNTICWWPAPHADDR